MSTDALDVVRVIGFLQWVSLAAAIGIPILAWHIGILEFSRSASGMKEFLVLAYLYLVGKVIQSWLIGPQLLRWHLADLGFVPFTALLVFAKAWMTQNIPIEKCFQAARIGAVLSLFAALAFEFFQAMAKQRGMYYGGDWVDVAMFAIGYLMTSRLLAMVIAEWNMVVMVHALSIPMPVPAAGSNISVRTKK